ncbi:uromodulin-like 1 [Pogona vitticeps]
MKISFRSVTKILAVFVFILCITTGKEISNTFTEKGLSLLGYHLCNYSVSKDVDKMVAYLKSYEMQTPCGGWIPWRVCTKTYYKEEYHPIVVSETVNLTDCCEGYEQVGLYCSLLSSVALNRSRDFASRPGVCPGKEAEALNISCTFDMDCPEHKKCCETSKGVGCLAPLPEGQTVTKYWYNVSVLVKMDFNKLNTVDPKLLNHSRLLHSMITGALWPLNVSVYHIQTTRAELYAETLASQILVGLQQLVPLVNISSLLEDIVMRVSEVIDIVVQDFDSSSPNLLYEKSNSSDLVRNSASVPQESGKSVDSECYPPTIRNYKIFSVTSNSFEVSWSVNSKQNHSFQIEVYKEKELIQQIETMDMELVVSNLEAGVMYTVKISYDVCGKTIFSYRNVKTDALMFGLTLRILNYNFTDQLLNASSAEYQEFASILMSEIRNSFPPHMSALYKAEKLKVRIDSFRTGSIIVKFKIIVEDLEFPKELSAFELMISSLFKSSILVIDTKSSLVEDWNECASRVENDCCRFAECINTLGSYMCRCKTTTDANPLRQGRNCEGEIVDPVTEMVPTSEANGMDGLPRISATPVSVAEKKRVTSFPSKSTETIIVPTGGTQESVHFLKEKMVSGSQRTNISEYARNNNTLNISETTTLVAEDGGTVTATQQSLEVERLSTAPEKDNSSLPMILGVSYPTSFPFVRNGPEQEKSTPNFLTERSSQKVQDMNVTKHPKVHALNYTLDKVMEKDNKLSEVLQLSYKEHTTDCGIPLPVERILFSGVTSTSFEVKWTTHFLLNPVFQFRLFEGKQVLREVKTQSNNLTITRLKPGILYTVEIKTEVCGKKSEPVQNKVMTAGQKFNGTVKITNLNYSPELSNCSHELFQNFTQMFLTEVRTFLPLNILQKMDAGMIRMLIMNITNGSIMVSFSLLIPEDMDASNVSWSFLDAFRHSNRFIIDNTSLSIHDYNECDKEETDCSPDASCYNTYGSYNCSCKEGFINVNAERHGRLCEECTILYFVAVLSSHDAGNTQAKDWNSTVLPLMHPFTSNQVSSPVSKNSSAQTLKDSTMGITVDTTSTEAVANKTSPPVPSLSFTKLSIKNEVQVFCEIEKIVVAIQKGFLQNQSISESSLSLGRPHCSGRKSNSSHVVLWTGWNECGTEVQSNTTHTILKTIIRNDTSSSLGVIHHFSLAVPVHCVFQNDLLASSGYTPEGIYTMFEDLHGSGHFLTEMQLFVGNSQIPQNFSISASDDIMIEVGIHTEDSKLKVVVGECWATPTNNSMDPLSFPFIHGSCPVPKTHTTIVSNGMFRKAQFKLKIFSFINNSVVYLHCKIHVCVEVPGRTCKASCSGFRSQRSGEIIAMPSASWGPLRKYSDDLKGEDKPGLGVGYIVLIVIGVFVLVLGITVLLIYRHHRKAGTYNFKIKSDNFNYQVFYD